MSASCTRGAVSDRSGCSAPELGSANAQPTIVTHPATGDAIRPRTRPSMLADSTTYIVMASRVMAYIVMASRVMACIVVAYIVMASRVMACIVMACIVMACIVMAYIVI